MFRLLPQNFWFELSIYMHISVKTQISFNIYCMHTHTVYTVYTDDDTVVSKYRVQYLVV